MPRKIRRVWMLVLPAAAAVSAVALLNLRSASADGVPATTPLFYSGRIAENGTPVEGVRPIVVGLWDDPTSTDVTRRKCESVTTAATITNGLFRVPLDPSCTTAVNANRDLYAEVTVGTVSLGRRKIGAVPYALQAAHAADVPPSALVLPSSLITTTTGKLPDFRNNATVTVAGKWIDIPGRALTFTKRYASSKLRITYQDTLGTAGQYYQGCAWQILLDETAVAAFSDADLDGAVSWRMSNAAHIAWASGAAGAHTVTVQNKGDRGAWTTGTTECLSGWNTTGNFLSVEEIP